MNKGIVIVVGLYSVKGEIFVCDKEDHKASLFRIVYEGNGIKENIIDLQKKEDAEAIKDFFDKFNKVIK